MKNITVSVDEETHRRARIRAAELDTSVSALVRGYLKRLAEGRVGTLSADGRSGVDTDETEVERRRRRLREVLADFDERGVGVSQRLTRQELYDEATNGADALR